jgi:hypothetical protein
METVKCDNEITARLDACVSGSNRTAKLDNLDFYSDEMTNGEKEAHAMLQRLLNGRSTGELTLKLISNRSGPDSLHLNIVTQGGDIPALSYEKELYEHEQHPKLMPYTILLHLCNMISSYDKSTPI